MHVWFSCEELGTLRLHALNGLVITVDEVGASADMGDELTAAEWSAADWSSRRVSIEQSR